MAGQHRVVVVVAVGLLTVQAAHVLHRLAHLAHNDRGGAERQLLLRAADQAVL